MSLLDQLVETPVLRISRFSDIDQFRSIETVVDARSIPLDPKTFKSGFAKLTLNSGAIHLQQTFPRILQVRYLSAGASIVFGMDDAVSAVMNGMEGSGSTMMIAKGGADCEFVEPRSNLVALISFDSVEDRGWPGDDGRAQLVAVRPEALQALRATIRDILMLASTWPETLLLPDMPQHLEESILNAIDHAVIPAVPLFETKRANLTHYLDLVRKLDELLHHNSGRTVYSADMAAQLKVSVRTLHTAAVAIRGMSLHRYMRLRRLWSVRQQLMTGSALDTVKTIALANGFWHLGEFSSLYRNLFGETPQQTLLAARRLKSGLQ